MKTDEKIILYIDGQLSKYEKTAFERELAESTDLQNQLQSYKKFLQGIEDISKPVVDERYFNNIIPRFRQRIEKKSIHKFRPVLVFSSAFSAVVVVFLVILLNNFTDTNPDYNSISFKDVDQTELNEYLTNSNGQILTNNIPVSMETQYESLIEAALYNELNLSVKEETMATVINNFDYNSIIATMDQQEANIIYASMINKKLF